VKQLCPLIGYLSSSCKVILYEMLSLMHTATLFYLEPVSSPCVVKQAFVVSAYGACIHIHTHAGGIYTANIITGLATSDNVGVISLGILHVRQLDGTLVTSRSTSEVVKPRTSESLGLR
jgi:hypothetical protein